LDAVAQFVEDFPVTFFCECPVNLIPEPETISGMVIGDDDGMMMVGSLGIFVNVRTNIFVMMMG
jgi:hypothetical protein